jgi:hypothetical protein
MYIISTFAMSTRNGKNLVVVYEPPFAFSKANRFLEIWRFPEMEVALDRWMVYFVEHPHLKWMIWYHHFGNPPYVHKWGILVGSQETTPIPSA